MPHSPRSRPKGRSNNSSRGNEKIQFHTSSAFAARDITPPLGQLFARALAPRQRRPPRPRSSSSNRTRVPPLSFLFLLSNFTIWRHLGAPFPPPASKFGEFRIPFFLSQTIPFRSHYSSLGTVMFASRSRHGTKGGAQSGTESWGLNRIS